MLDLPCRVLLIEDEPEDAEIVENMLRGVRSAFFKKGIELACVETLSQAKQIISEQEFDIILLDLMLPDSRYMKSLEELQSENLGIPIIVQTTLEDEVVAVKALELGACGYLPKVVNDRNLLLYAIRTAIEQKQQLNQIEPLASQQQELDTLDSLLMESTKAKSNHSLEQRLPDIFAELKTRYGELLDRYVEQKIYQVEYELTSEISVLIEQLGYLQATPKDLIEIHTSVLKPIVNNSSVKKGKRAFMIEGRYLLLELMGKLTCYYRRYYIGLNKINLVQDYRSISAPD